MRVRRTVVAVAMVAAVTVSTAGTGVVAFAASGSASPGSVAAAKKGPAEKPSPGKGKESPGKGTDNPGKGREKPGKGKEKKKVVFSASGTVTAVDAAQGTVSVAARGGTKDVRGRTVTITVPAGVRVLLNGKRATVGALAAGHRITVTGTRVDAAYTAAKVLATGKRVKPAPKPSPSVTPTVPPTTVPDPAVTPEPSGPGVTPEPSDPAVTPEPSDPGASDPAETPEPSETPEPGDDD